MPSKPDCENSYTKLGKKKKKIDGFASMNMIAGKFRDFGGIYHGESDRAFERIDCSDLLSPAVVESRSFRRSFQVTTASNFGTHRKFRGKERLLDSRV